MINSSLVLELLKPHGSCRSQDSSEWTGTIPLPGGLASFYHEVGPVSMFIDGYGDSTFIPSLSQLWDHQAGYRWDARTGAPIDDWNSDWIVVAVEGADPFIYCNGAILFAHHGEGLWEPDQIYPDLNTMAACMAIVGSVVSRAGENLVNDDCSIRPEFRAQVVSQLTQILGDEREAEAIVQTAGWS